MEVKHAEADRKYGSAPAIVLPPSFFFPFPAYTYKQMLTLGLCALVGASEFTNGSEFRNKTCGRPGIHAWKKYINTQAPLSP